VAGRYRQSFEIRRAEKKNILKWGDTASESDSVCHGLNRLSTTGNRTSHFRLTRIAYLNCLWNPDKVKNRFSWIF